VKNYLKNSIHLILLATVGLFIGAVPAQADLAEDLQGLIVQSQNLEVQLKNITLNPDSVCGPLVEANKQARALSNSAAALNSSLAAPLQTDAALLTAMDTLSMTVLNISNESLRLSLDLKALSTVSRAITLKDGMTATLQLSDDIGAMADRIGEMSDKILVMSDNIGVMADRILVSQQLQSQNLALTQQGLLQTQTNALTLVGVLETATNDLALSSLIAEGTVLTAKLSALVLNPFTMKTQMQYAAASIRTYLDKVKALHTTMLFQAGTGTSYLSTTTLLNQQNMTIMLSSLANVLDGYTIAIGGLQAITSKPTLTDSMKSMLQMSADIGLMANRVLEMGDVILAMADNIGMVADQILVAQQLQNANMVVTQASVLGAQEFAIGVLKRLVN